MNIRPYTPEDQPAVIDVFRSNVPKYFAPQEVSGLRDFLTRHGGTYFVVEKDVEILGSGGYALNDGAERTVSLCWGMIRADHLGSGLGKILTDFRIRAARERYGDLPLVIGTSQHTRGFYEKFGFRLVRSESDHFAPGIDLCEMRLGDPQ